MKGGKNGKVECEVNIDDVEKKKREIKDKKRF